MQRAQAAPYHFRHATSENNIPTSKEGEKRREDALLAAHPLVSGLNLTFFMLVELGSAGWSLECKASSSNF